MIVISIGLVAAVAALVFLRNPTPQQKSVETSKNRALVVQAQKPQSLQDSDRTTQGSQTLSATVIGALPHSLRRITSREKAKLLSALSARLLIWKVDLRRGLRRGDKIKMVYRPVSKQSKYQIEAMTYKSLKHGKIFRFYRFKPRGQKFAVYYDEKGRSVEQYLEDSPMRTYEQVTSILKMRPKHKGVDFKAPQGTKIYMPWRGRVISKNWNVRYNGYCLKVEFTNKRWRGNRVHALFLHLHKIMPNIRRGRIIAAGAPIAEVGNTGRSTAAHLHYQTQTPRGRIIDPYRLHNTYRRNLPGRHAESFQRQRRSLDRILKQAKASPHNNRVVRGDDQDDD